MKNLLVLDAHLEGKNFVVGDCVTLADIALGTVLLSGFRYHLHAGK